MFLVSKAKGVAVGRKLIFIFFGLIFLGSLLWPQVPKPVSGYQNVSIEDFDAILASSDPFVVDVHTPEQKHLEGTDAFIDFTQVPKRLDEFPSDKNAEILVYCRTGSMSQIASQSLIDAGYTNVKNLVGGLEAWREQHQGVFLTPQFFAFGTVIYGEVVTTEFTLQNNTSQTLELTRISTSCSCTKAQADTLTVKPWEQTKITVTFDPAVHRDDTDLGDITRTIYLDTNHPNFDHLTATITATVIKL